MPWRGLFIEHLPTSDCQSGGCTGWWEPPLSLLPPPPLASPALSPAAGLTPENACWPTKPTSVSYNIPTRIPFTLSSGVHNTNSKNEKIFFVWKRCCSWQCWVPPGCASLLQSRAFWDCVCQKGSWVFGQTFWISMWATWTLCWQCPHCPPREHCRCQMSLSFSDSRGDFCRDSWEMSWSPSLTSLPLAGTLSPDSGSSFPFAVF